MSPPQVRSRAGNRAGFMSLGFAMALTIFIWEKAPAVSLQWFPPIHEEKGTQLHVYHSGISVNKG